MSEKAKLNLKALGLSEKLTKLKILALDVSSTSTGYSRFEYDIETRAITHIDTGSIKSAKSDILARIDFIDTEMYNKGLHSWADVVAIENYAFAGTRVVQMAEVIGIFKYAFYKAKVPRAMIAPATVKRLIGGSGKASKEEVLLGLYREPCLKDYSFRNTDESDSAAIGLTFIKLYEESKDARTVSKTKGKSRKSRVKK